MASYQIFGLDSGWHHLIDVLFHALASVLLLAALRRMTGALWPSAFVAFVFALHPLHAESVAWVAERKDVLCAFFWCLTLWCYARYVSRPSAASYTWVVLAFCGGLMSKSMIVTLPLVLLLLDFWPVRRHWRRALLWEKVPLLALAGGVSVLTLVSQRQGHAVRSLTSLPVSLIVERTGVDLCCLHGPDVLAGQLGRLLPLSAQLARLETPVGCGSAGRHYDAGGPLVSSAPIPHGRVVLVSRDSSASYRIGSGRRTIVGGSVHLPAHHRTYNHIGVGGGRLTQAISASFEVRRGRGGGVCFPPVWY